MHHDTIRLLVVDGNQRDVELMCEQLKPSREAQYSIQVAQSLTAALECLKADELDAVLLNLNLPECRGSETLSRIQRQDSKLPIVIMTGTYEEAIALDEYCDAAQEIFQKADLCRPGALSRSIRNTMHRCQLRQQIELLLEEVEAARVSLLKKNERLAELYQTAQKFVDNVSHDFRTPLSVIAGYITLIQEGLAGELTDQQRRMLRVLEDRTDDLNRMVDDMLDASRLGAGMLLLRRQNHRPVDIVNHVRPPLERKTGIRKMELEIDVPEGLPEVFCDAEKVGRTISNLAVNAIKHCGGSPKIRLSARHDPQDKSVEFAVADNGSGIQPKVLKRILDQLRQSKKTAWESPQEMGLGLSVAKELAEFNLGRINVDSRPGHGSQFSFTVPAADPTEVVRRYLHWISGRDFAETATDVMLAIAELIDEADAHLVTEVDVFLHHFVRCSDLVIQTKPGRWGIIVPICRWEAEHFFDRYQRSWHETNCNRPSSPLPKVEVTPAGVWTVPEQFNDVLARFNSLIAERQPAIV